MPPTKYVCIVFIFVLAVPKDGVAARAPCLSQWGRPPPMNRTSLMIATSCVVPGVPKAHVPIPVREAQPRIVNTRAACRSHIMRANSGAPQCAATWVVVSVNGLRGAMR